MYDLFKIFGLVLTGIFFFFSVAHSDQLDTQTYDIAQELMCPVCRGQTVANSNSDLAHDMRMVIRQKLKEGESKQQILDYFRARYGDTILSSPPKRGVNLVLWLLPLIGLISGLIFLIWFLKKERNINQDIQNAGSSQSIDKGILKKIEDEMSSENQ